MLVIRSPAHARPKDQPHLAVGSSGGRAFLSADLRSISRSHCRRIVEAGRPNSLGTRADPGIGPGKRHRGCSLFPAGRRGVHPGPWPGRDHRDAGPQAANACCQPNSSSPQRNSRTQFSSGFDPAVPDGFACLDAFPRKIWARLGARCIRGMQSPGMVHPPVYGLPELRAEIAAYLHVSRGIDCSPSQVFVTSGYRHTMALIGHALLKGGGSRLARRPGLPAHARTAGAYACGRRAGAG